MKLRTFLASVCGVGAVLAFAFFMWNTDSAFSRRFSEANRLHERSVREYAMHFLKAKFFLTEAAARNLETDPRTAKALLTKEFEGHRKFLETKAEELRTFTGADLVRFESSITSGFRVEGGGSNLMLWHMSPISLYGEKVGSVHFGYRVNQSIKEQIESITHAKFDFARGSGMPPVSLVLGATDVQQLQRETFASSLVSGLLSLAILVGFLVAMIHVFFLSRFRRIVRAIEDAAVALDRGDTPVFKPSRSFVGELSSLSLAFTAYTRKLEDFKQRLVLKTRTEAMGEKAAQVAHDLSGPLTALEMTLDLDMDHPFPEPKRAAIHRLFARLRNVISSVQTDAPDETDVEKEFDLKTLALSVLEEKRAETRGERRLQVLAAAEDATVRACETEVLRALNNLIQNAIDASPAKSEVCIAVGVDDGHAFLEVADSGKGIPENLLKRVGERGFSWGKEKGTGLGLWHAREIAMRSGGTLDVVSKEGVGTRVRMRLPLVRLRREAKK